MDHGTNSNHDKDFKSIQMISTYNDSDDEDDNYTDDSEHEHHQFLHSFGTLEKSLQGQMWRSLTNSIDLTTYPSVLDENDSKVAEQPLFAKNTKNKKKYQQRYDIGEWKDSLLHDDNDPSIPSPPSPLEYDTDEIMTAMMMYNFETSGMYNKLYKKYVKSQEATEFKKLWWIVCIIIIIGVLLCLDVVFDIILLSFSYQLLLSCLLFSFIVSFLWSVFRQRVCVCHKLSKNTIYKIIKFRKNVDSSKENKVLLRSLSINHVNMIDTELEIDSFSFQCFQCYCGLIKYWVILSFVLSMICAFLAIVGFISYDIDGDFSNTHEIIDELTSNKLDLIDYPVYLCILLFILSLIFLIMSVIGCFPYCMCFHLILRKWAVISMNITVIFGFLDILSDVLTSIKIYSNHDTKFFSISMAFICFTSLIYQGIAVALIHAGGIHTSSNCILCDCFLNMMLFIPGL